MLYGSKNVLETVWEDTDTRPVWLAHYTDKTDYKGKYRIWQAGNTGRIDGIDGAVDLDIMYD
jgi:GH25 family lysozyme M1 (1,4-beta-N-acetylmuramidase)